MIARPLFALEGGRQPPSARGYDCIDNGEYLPGSDILTVRYGEPEPSSPQAREGERLYLRSSPYRGRLFRASAADQNLLTDPHTTTRRLMAHTYYLAPSGRRCGGESIPALRRKYLDSRGNPRGEELAPGVEDLQLLFGLDDDEDGQVERYLNPAETTAAGWGRVRSVRIWLLVRAECPEAGYLDENSYLLADRQPPFTPNDAYRRRLFVTTVWLRNRSGEE